MTTGTLTVTWEDDTDKVKSMRILPEGTLEEFDAMLNDASTTVRDVLIEAGRLKEND